MYIVVCRTFAPTYLNYQALEQDEDEEVNGTLFNNYIYINVSIRRDFQWIYIRFGVNGLHFRAT